MSECIFLSERGWGPRTPGRKEGKARSRRGREGRKNGETKDGTDVDTGDVAWLEGGMSR